MLNKPGKLTDEEFAIIKSHTSKGYDALKDISIMPELAVGAQAHHERPDGKGYPNHLKGDEIPRVAQIIAVADCFDAMYSNRPYRNRMNFDKVVSIIKEVSGTQLTPDVVDAFLRLVDKGEFRAPDDMGGGSTENIENIPMNKSMFWICLFLVISQFSCREHFDIRFQALLFFLVALCSLWQSVHHSASRLHYPRMS